jgi:hypothetical protein
MSRSGVVPGGARLTNVINFAALERDTPDPDG